MFIAPARDYLLVLLDTVRNAELGLAQYAVPVLARTSTCSFAEGDHDRSYDEKYGSRSKQLCMTLVS